MLIPVSYVLHQTEERKKKMRIRFEGEVWLIRCIEKIYLPLGTVNLIFLVPSFLVPSVEDCAVRYNMNKEEG